MAREVVTKCDKCGQAGEDVRTYTLRVDGSVWEADLDERHCKTVTITEFQKIGRQLENGSRRSSTTANLERRIRGVPDKPAEE